jgi:hypothetical protein
MTTSSFHGLNNAELVRALHDIDPLASNLSDLLTEMWQRELPEAERYGLKLMAANLDGNLNRHPDTKLYDVLEVMCAEGPAAHVRPTLAVKAGGICSDRLTSNPDWPPVTTYR